MTSLVEIEFHPAFPTALYEEVRADLAGVLPIVAREVASVRVALADEELPEAVAAVQVFRQYHAVRLWFSGEYFTYDARRRRATLLHEMGHVLLDDLTREAARVLHTFVEDERTRKHLLEILEESEDRVVEALALAWDIRHDDGANDA